MMSAVQGHYPIQWLDALHPALILVVQYWLCGVNQCDSVKFPFHQNKEGKKKIWQDGQIKEEKYCVHVKRMWFTLRLENKLFDDGTEEK